MYRGCGCERELEIGTVERGTEVTLIYARPVCSRLADWRRTLGRKAYGRMLLASAEGYGKGSIDSADAGPLDAQPISVVRPAPPI